MLNVRTGEMKRDIRPSRINNHTILHSRTSFLDGPSPNQKRHLLRLWLKFPTPWPIGPHFPEHKGYAVSSSKTLLEV